MEATVPTVKKAPPQSAEQFMRRPPPHQQEVLVRGEDPHRSGRDEARDSRAVPQRWDRDCGARWVKSFTEAGRTRLKGESLREAGRDLLRTRCITAGPWFRSREGAGSLERGERGGGAAVV